MTTAALTDAECQRIINDAYGGGSADIAAPDVYFTMIRAAYALGLARAPAMPREPTGRDQPMLIERDFAQAINRHSAENISDTPDHVLAYFLRLSLAAFDAATIERERWYGRAMYDAAPAQDQGAAGVAPRMNSEPGNPEWDKRAMYRPAHQGESCDSASANPCPMPAAAPAQATEADPVVVATPCSCGGIDTPYGRAHRGNCSYMIICDLRTLRARDADAIAALRAENIKLRGWVNTAEQSAGNLQRKLNASEADVARLTSERDVLRLAVKDDAQWAQENERLTRERDEWKTKCGDANIWGLRNSAAWKDRAERLAAALRQIRVTGPDADGLVWIICTRPNGDAGAVSVNADRIVGTVLAAWAAECAALAQEDERD